MEAWLEFVQDVGPHKKIIKLEGHDFFKDLRYESELRDRYVVYWKGRVKSWFLKKGLNNCMNSSCWQRGLKQLKVGQSGWQEMIEAEQMGDMLALTSTTLLCLLMVLNRTLGLCLLEEMILIK